MNFSEENIERFDQIESYLNGSMAHGDRIAFEKLLKTNQELAEEVAVQRSINFGLKYIDVPEITDDEKNKLIDSLKAIHIEEQQNKVEKPSENIGRRKLFRYILGVAAAIVILLLIIRFVWEDNTREDMALVAQYQILPFEEYRGNGIPGSVFLQLEKEYLAGRYEEGLQIMDQLPDSIADETIIVYVRGFFHSAKNDSTEALKAFRQVTHDTSSIFDDRAKLQIVLVYIQNHDRLRALIQLDKILMDSDIRPGLKKDAESIRESIL